MQAWPPDCYRRATAYLTDPAGRLLVFDRVDTPEGHFDGETQHAVMNAVEEALARLGRREVPFGDGWTVLPELARGPVALPEGWESLPS